MSRLLPGQTVYWNDEPWLLLDLVDSTKLLLRHLKTRQTVQVSPAEIRLNPTLYRSRKALGLIPDQVVLEASKKMEVLRPLAVKPKGTRDKAQIEAAAEKLEVTPSTIYRWLSRYDALQTLEAFTRTPRSDRNARRLTEQAEQIMRQAIEEEWKKQERPTVARAYREAAARFHELKLPKPSLSTFRARVLDVPAREATAARYGAKTAREQFSPYTGEFPYKDHPQHCYQIDHTPVDLIVVDDEHRLSIRRPFLTLVIDTYTRMIAGFCLSLEEPSRLTAGMAMAHALMTKDAWLAERGIKGRWPIYGPPKIVHTDNGADFKSKSFTLSCAWYGCENKRRPKGFPNTGGTVERAFRTFMQEVQAQPGSTFSNVVKRGDYDSEGKAVFTLSELECWFAAFILYYHELPHAGLDDAIPIKVFDEQILGTPDRPGLGLPVPIEDEYMLHLRFLPHWGRTVQQKGIELDKIWYFSDALRRWIGATEKLRNKDVTRKFQVARDPRDISVLYFFDPEAGEYIKIPYADARRVPMTAWELQAVREGLAKQSIREPNEDQIFEYLAQMRRIAQEAQDNTKKQRRQAQRDAENAKALARREALKAAKPGATNPGAAEPVPDSAGEPSDPKPPDDLDDIQPFSVTVL